MIKKPSFTAALAQQEEAAAEAPAPTPKAKDDRINTTVRISPEGLRALKVIAADKRIRVNDLVLEGIEMVLALNGQKMQLRK